MSFFHNIHQSCDFLFKLWHSLQQSPYTFPDVWTIIQSQNVCICIETHGIFHVENLFWIDLKSIRFILHVLNIIDLSINRVVWSLESPGFLLVCLFVFVCFCCFVVVLFVCLFGFFFFFLGGGRGGWGEGVLIYSWSETMSSQDCFKHNHWIYDHSTFQLLEMVSVG